MDLLRTINDNDCPAFPPSNYFGTVEGTVVERFGTGSHGTTTVRPVHPNVKQEFEESQKRLESMIRDTEVRLKDMVGDFTKEEEAYLQGKGFSPYGQLVMIFHRRKDKEDRLNPELSAEEMRWRHIVAMEENRKKTRQEQEAKKKTRREEIEGKRREFYGMTPRCWMCYRFKFDIEILRVRLEAIKINRDYVLDYMKHVLDELIRSGKDTKLFVEGVLVEQNMSACYASIETFLYCIERQLSAMHNQSECLDECKVAVASLMYAAARFSDLPELQDLRTLFTEKYGNSVETFVNKEFVERLRSEPSTEEMKVQLMHDIGKEFSIKWDSKALEQNLFTPLPADHDQPRHWFPKGRSLVSLVIENDRTLWSSKFKFDIKTLKMRLQAIRQRRIVLPEHLKKFVAPDVYHLKLWAEQNMAACYADMKKFAEYVAFCMQYEGECPDECPNKCKEAVASLMYAAGSFSDLPELQYLRDIFTGKYGNSLETFVNKEFLERLRSIPVTEKHMDDTAKESLRDCNLFTSTCVGDHEDETEDDGTEDDERSAKKLGR